MISARQDSWVNYYEKIYADGNSWLDCSNPHVQEQTFGIAVEAAGPVGGKRCLDFGCGRGQLSLGVAGFQARSVVAVDIMTESIRALRERHPHVQWEVGSPEDEAFCQSLGLFDVVFVIELLELVDWRRSLRILWNSVAPGGRIVAIVPNKSNKIVQKTIARFEGTYDAPNTVELAQVVADLPAMECWAYRGMDFQQDQRIVPYVTTAWANAADVNFSPNRLVVVIRKQS